MDWRNKKQNKTAIVKDWRSGLLRDYDVLTVSPVQSTAGVTIEGLFVSAAYRQPTEIDLPEKYGFNLIHKKERIYAVDIEFERPRSHRNKTCRSCSELTFANQYIDGLHEHSWCPYKICNYASPLPADMHKMTMEQHWQYFCQKINVKLGNEFRHPNDDQLTGQTSLL